VRNGILIAVVDTGPLFATFDTDDPNHARSVHALSAVATRIVIPELVVAETLHLIGTRLGPDVEARFLSGLHRSEIVSPHPIDWSRIAELVMHYRDFPLGGVDASIIALAERLNTDLIFTLDRRHFSVVRPRHVPAFRLLPE